METTLQQQQAAIVRNQARVIDLLRWDEQVYAEFMYESGLQYLLAYVGKEDQPGIDKLNQRSEFWNWWKSQWNIRNEIFIHEWDGWEDKLNVEELRLLYDYFHNPKTLAAEIAPPSLVFGTDFIKIEMAAV